jgi:O-antigen/teichoic acid export membrane protein
MLAAVGSMGIAQAVLLRAKHDPISHNAVMRCGFYIAVTLGTVLAGVGAIAVVLVLPNDYRRVALWGIAMLAYIPVQLVNWVLLSEYLGQQQFTTYYVLQILPSIIYCAVMGGLVCGGGASGASFAMACLFGHVVTTAVLLFACRQRIRKREPSHSHFMPLLRLGFTLHAPTVLIAVIQRLDLALVIWLTGPEKLGLYAAAQAIATGQLGLTAPFAQAVFADATRNLDGSRLSFQLQLSQVMVLVSALLSVASGPFLLRTCFGLDFAAAADLILPLTLLIALRNSTDVAGQILRAYGRSSMLTRTFVVQIVLSLVLGATALKVGGCTSMAWVLSGCECVITVAILQMTTNRLDVPALTMWTLPDVWNAIAGVRSGLLEYSRRRLVKGSGGYSVD